MRCLWLVVWVVYFGLRRSAERAASRSGEPRPKPDCWSPPRCIRRSTRSNASAAAPAFARVRKGDILGLINGKAVLVEPSECIGHGACRAACPSDAISLVFGTEKRGVDIPHVGADFQTNVPGIFIAGELGGMGLIRNAIEQGRQAIEFGARARRSRAGRSLRRRDRRRRAGGLFREPRGHAAQAALRHDRAGQLRRHRRALSARQARDDRARHAAADRQDQIQGDQQGEAARILAGRRAQDRS